MKPKAKASKPRASKKGAGAAETAQEQPAEPDAAEDVPDDPDADTAAPVASEPKSQFGTPRPDHQTWDGQIEPRADGEAKLHTSTWKAKLIPGDDEVGVFFGTISSGDGRLWYDAKVAGTLELVPWEKDGTSMPPYRRITVHAIEVHRTVEPS
jgi:hypothetical protein